MAQYKIGTVSLEEGSKTVTGLGTLWLSEGISSGDLFTIEDSGTVYEINTVVAEDQLELTSEFKVPERVSGGVYDDPAAVFYTIHRDFTSAYNLPLLSDGDVDMFAFFNYAMRIIDERLTYSWGNTSPAPDLAALKLRDPYSRTLAGTVSVTNASQDVTVSGADLFENDIVRVNDMFTLDGTSEIYIVTQVFSPTLFRIDRPFNGPSASGQNWFASRSFTPHWDIPLMSDGEVVTADVYSRAMNRIFYIMENVLGVTP